MKLRRLTTFCAILGALAACTNPLTEQSANDLDRFAIAAASVAGTPDRVQRALYNETQANRNLCNYLRGANYQLDLGGTKVPVTALAAAQATTGKALTGYVKALVEASRGASLAKLEEARLGFGTAIGGFAAEAGVDAPLGDIANQVFALAERAGEASRQKRIRVIMRDAIDPLFLLEDLLTRDAAQVSAETERFALQWEHAARCVLSASRTFPAAADRLDFLSKRRAEINADLALIRSGPEAVRRLRIAHVLTVTEQKPLDEAFAEFIEILQEVDTLAKSIAGEPPL